MRRIDNNDSRVPDKPIVSCTGFTYNAPKIYNKLPIEIKKIKKVKVIQKGGQKLDLEKYTMVLNNLREQ